VVLRSRIVLLATDGLQNKPIAAILRVAPRLVALWRGRLIECGIEGLVKNAPRPGRAPSVSRLSLLACRDYLLRLHQFWPVRSVWMQCRKCDHPTSVTAPLVRLP
jgi:hypothetical protein